MADLQKHRAHESLNTESAATWEQQTKMTVGSSPTNVDVTNYHTVLLQTDEDIYYGFSADTTAILGTAANNLYLKGGDTIYELAIPHGVGDSSDVYLHALRKTSSSASARLVYT